MSNEEHHREDVDSEQFQAAFGSHDLGYIANKIRIFVLLHLFACEFLNDLVDHLSNIDNILMIL